MPHTKTTLILMLAFALPGAAQALGLGEIHVDSAFNEPLAAEIDIVGATAEDLAGITASIADRETFLRFGVDRPAFLSTAAFKITRDSKGQPVLTIRSTDAVSEPLVDMLIDLRWHNGELIRQYTLLLDPPSFPSANRCARLLCVRCSLRRRFRGLAYLFGGGRRRVGAGRAVARHCFGDTGGGWETRRVEQQGVLTNQFTVVPA